MMHNTDDEKGAGPSLSPPDPRSRRSLRVTSTTMILAVLFAPLLFVLIISAPGNVGDRLKLWLAEQTTEHGWDRSRLEGDEYLLGVGKADITGYTAGLIFCVLNVSQFANMGL
jgi:hypothetical protein